MAVRNLALDYPRSGTNLTVHKDNGTSTDYATLALLLVAVSIEDCETVNWGERVNSTGDSSAAHWGFSGGTAPMTARPAQGATKRAAGQGCRDCASQAGCVAMIGKKRADLSNNHGRQCSSYSAA